MLNFAEQTGSGAVMIVWSFLHQCLLFLFIISSLSTKIVYIRSRKNRESEKTHSMYCTTNTIMTLFNLSSFLILGMVFSKASAFATPKRFVITGASGYLGREIVNSILENEQTDDESEILCLVRESRVEDEKKYWNSESSVSVRKYDMLDGGKTIEDVLSSIYSGDSKNDNECCIYHVASIFTPTEDHKQMALDNVKGAEDLMNAVAKFPNEKTRVILTSSMAGVRGGGQTPKNGKWYTEEDWNTQAELGASWGASYQWSKAESERRAWDISKELGVKFTSLNPSFIFGPPSNPETSQSFSISTVSKWVSGEGAVQSRLCVDVRDVAKAHVIAGINDKTIGERIIISTEARIPSETMAEELKRMAIEMGIGEPDKIYPDTNFDGGAIKIGEQEVSCADRMESLLDGFKVRDVEATMRDMAKVLLEMEKR
jgi:nucleoside-diphosphate-sugar epimerase